MLNLTHTQGSSAKYNVRIRRVKNFSKVTTFMLGQKKITSKINSAEYFLELWGSSLQHFWVLLEKSEIYLGKNKKQIIGSNKGSF